MFSHRSSGKIGSGGVKPTPKDQLPIQTPQTQKEETVFRTPKEKKKKLKFQRE
jgi:hypothetical protein